MADLVPGSNLNAAIVDQVANQAFSAIAGQQAQLANQALANTVNFQQVMNAQMVALSAKANELLLTTDVAEAAGLVPVSQVATKAAQTTPPITAPDPATSS